MTEKNDLVTIVRASNAIEANLIKSKLESEGVTAFVMDENIVGVQPLYTNAVGGVRVQVPEKELARAQEILNLVNEQSAKPKYACPQCGTTHISFSKLPKFLSIFTFLLSSIPFIPGRRKWTCLSCKHTWVR